MSGINEPFVSILLTVYKGMPYLPSAVDSIFKQTFTNFEFIIVNDASPDDSRSYLESIDDERIKLFDNERNLGQTESLNKGLRLAKGKYVARIDQDDLSHPDRLAKQVDFLEKHPGTALLGTQARIIDQSADLVLDHYPDYATDHVSLKWRFLFKNCMVHSSAMFRRKVVLEEMNGYDSRFVIAQDFDLWSRILAKYKVGNLPESLIDYRYLANSTSMESLDLLFDEAERICKKNIEVTFGDLVVDFPHWQVLLATIVRSCLNGKASVSDLHYCLGKMRSTFFQLYPEAVDNAEIDQFYNYLLMEMADVFASNREASFELWRQSRKHRKSEDNSHSFWRLVALWLGGAEARSLLRRISKIK